MIQFYAPNLLENPVLGPDESHHCMKVVRKKVGDEILVTDGKGVRALCRIQEIHGREVRLEILSSEIVPKSWCGRIILAVAPTKNSDRMSWLVEKAVEIGVDDIIFLKCQNSERKTVNIDRLKRNAVSAMNQSLKTRLPELKGICRIEDLFGYKAEKFFGYCDSSSEKFSFAKEIEADQDILITIGPEGDFSRDEVVKMTENGFKAVTFGEERLRTETAALYGVTAVHVVSNLKD